MRQARVRSKVVSMGKSFYGDRELSPRLVEEPKKAKPREKISHPEKLAHSDYSDQEGEQKSAKMEKALFRDHEGVDLPFERSATKRVGKATASSAPRAGRYARKGPKVKYSTLFADLETGQNPKDLQLNSLGSK